MPKKKWTIYKKIKVLVDVLISDFTHLPHGYQAWYGLSPQKQLSFRKKLNDQFYRYLFDTEFKRALLRAILTQSGTPTLEGRGLYNWAVGILYEGSERELYKDWLELVKDKD